MVYQAHHDMIDVRDIVDPNLPTDFHEFRIFFISDIHKRLIKKQTLSNINQPIDLVIIGGDLTERGVPLDRTRENLMRLSLLNAPIYFVWGNNDYEIEPQETLIQLLKSCHVNILENSYHDIKRKHAILRLYGTDFFLIDIESRNDILTKADLDGDYHILVAHNPADFYQLHSCLKKRINLVLSGHTHGGQIRLFGLGLYQKGGLSTIEQTHILISEGYGYTLLPFRLQTKAECHVITLKKR